MKLCKLAAIATACGLFALIAIGNAHAGNSYQLFDTSGFSTGLGNGFKIFLVWGKPIIDGTFTGIANVASNCYAFCFRASVSEPNTSAMIVAGLGLMGYVARRRNQPL